MAYRHFEKIQRECDRSIAWLDRASSSLACGSDALRNALQDASDGFPTDAARREAEALAGRLKDFVGMAHDLKCRVRNLHDTVGQLAKVRQEGS